MAFNSALVGQHCNGQDIIALDPNFIAKSGKKTPRIGYFCSDQAAPIKRRLKMLCFHLHACQTLTGSHNGKTLADIYTN